MESRPLVCADSETVAGQVLHHGITDQAAPGDPRAHLERHGGVPLPPGHSALPAVLPPAQSPAAGCHHGWTVQPSPGPLPNPSPPSFHHRTLQVLPANFLRCLGVCSSLTEFLTLQQKSDRIRQWLTEVCCLAGLRFCWTAGLCSGVELCRTRPLPRPWFPPCCWKTAHRARHWLTFCWRERLLSISSSTNRSMVRKNSEHFYIYMPRPLASSKERE